MIFIPGEVPSLKNGKIKTLRGVFPSKSCQNYLRSLGIHSYSSRDKSVVGYKRSPMIFPILRLREYLKTSEYPFFIGLHFVRKTEGTADFNNLTHIIADLMVAGNIIRDDSMKYCFFVPLPINGRYFSVDKVKPGVCIDRVNINVTSYSESEVENEQVD